MSFERDGRERGPQLWPEVSKRDHLRGPSSASVTLLAFGDYASVRCALAERVAREVCARLGDRMRFGWRHFPPDATRTHPAEAVEAASAQGCFWAMHDALFAHVERGLSLDNGHLVDLARQQGLDVTRFLRDVSGHVHAEKVRADIESGRKSGVSSAPTFFVNGARFDGGWDLASLLKAVEEGMKKEK